MAVQTIPETSPELDELVRTLAQLEAYVDTYVLVEAAHEEMDPWVPDDEDLEVRILSL
jgi:hypothetical protein